MTGTPGSIAAGPKPRAFSLGAATAFLASFLLPWTQIVRDDGVAMAVFYHAFFAALWLVSAACFWRAATPERSRASAFST